MLKGSLWAPKSEWRPTPVSQMPAWPRDGVVCVDVETKDPDLKTMGCGARRANSKMVGIGFAIEGGPAHYLPYDHLHPEDNLDREHVLSYFREQARDFRGVLVAANAQYDLDYLAESDIRFQPRRVWDPQIAEPLLDENQFRYGLEAIAERRGLPGKDETLLRRAAEAYGIDPKKEMWKLPARYVGAYGERDNRLPIELLRIQLPILESEDLTELFDLESRLLPVLLKMRRRGVRIDFDQLDRVERWSFEQEAEAISAIYRATGVRVDYGAMKKPTQVVAVMQAVGFSPGFTPTGKHKTDNDTLERIPGEVGKLMRRAKQMTDLRSKFVNAVRKHSIDGRIHTTFNQLKKEKEDGGEAGTVARLSSSYNNMQQQPARDPEIGPMWRAIYLPEEGAEWISADYSQQEPRWTIHFAEEIGCTGAAEAAQRYRDDPSTDSHNMMTEIVHGAAFVLEAYQAGPDHPGYKEAKHLRDSTKTINLGLAYGMGAVKLCVSLGLPTEWIESRTGRMIEVAGAEGAAILQQFDERAPFIKELSDAAEEVAKDRGFIRTILRRRARFPVNPKHGKYDWTRKAGSRLIQGSSADQMKKAMVDLDEAHPDIWMALQVHDELDGSGTRADGETIAEVMLAAVECNVPHKVDLEMGPNWGEIH